MAIIGNPIIAAVKTEVDDRFDEYSTNPVQNKVIYGALSVLQETVEDVEKVQKITNAGRTIMIGLDGKLSASSGNGLTDGVKNALLNIFRHVAYIDDKGQDHYNELYEALNTIKLIGVEATFTQGSLNVYTSTSLESLRKYLIVKAVYSNGEKVTTDDYTLTGTLKVGTSILTVTCEDFTDTFNVNVSSNEVIGIECVFNQGTAVIYASNSLESLKQYLKVKAIYSDGTKEEITGYSLSGKLSVGTSTITATYGSFTDTFDVVVSAVTVTSISCVYSQSKTVYDSDSLDVLKSDLAVNAVYSDGSSGTIPSSEYSLSGTLSAGTSTITVSYGGMTDTFSVTVTHRAGTYSVINNLTNCTNSNGASTVIEGGNYSGTITANAGYTMTGATVRVTMGGTDITLTAYRNGTISIASVSGNIVINASAVAVTLSSISAVFTQGQTVVYNTDSLDVLKPMLTVTATYPDGSTATIQSTDYTLSGTLSVGTSVITVTFEGKTDTFNVTVSKSQTALIRNWDFTKSLTDTVASAIAKTTATRDANGLTFTAPNKYLDIGTVYSPDRTYEIDISYIGEQYPSTSQAYRRIFAFGENGTNTSAKTAGLPLPKKLGYTEWVWYSGSAWESEAMATHGDYSVFDGKTLKIYIDENNYAYVYSKTIGANDSTYVKFGQSSAPLNSYSVSNAHVYAGGDSDALGNARLLAYRVYEGDKSAAPITLSSISAAFTQGQTVVYDTDSLDVLRPMLVVTATYSDSTTQTVTGYTLSGTLTKGTSTITASYSGKTATFSVNVTKASGKVYYANYDFTESLNDKSGHGTLVLSHGAEATSDAQRTSAGLVFSQPTQVAYFGEIDPVGKTFEFTISNFDFKGSTDAHIRLLQCSNGVDGMGPLIYRKETGYNAYSFWKSDSTDISKTWGYSPWAGLQGSGTTVINSLSGKTVKIVFENEHTVSLYLNDELKSKMMDLYYNTPAGATPAADSRYNKSISFGGITDTPTASEGDQCYNLTLSRLSIYENI